jgi:hypothetical protein
LANDAASTCAYTRTPVVTFAAGLFIGGGYTALGRPSRTRPLRGLLSCWSRRAASLGGGSSARCEDEPAEPRREEAMPLHHAKQRMPHAGNATRTSRRKLSAAEVAALSAAGFFPALAAALPPAARARLTEALDAARSAPAAAFATANGIAPGALAAAASQLGINALAVDAFANVTLAQPQGPLPLISTTFVPLFDVEMTVRLLLHQNQNDLSLRVGPTFRVAGDGTVTEGFLYLPLFTSFITQTTQQLAAAASGVLNATAARLRRDAATAAAQAAANKAALEAYFGVQLGPLPLGVAVRHRACVRAVMHAALQTRTDDFACGRASGCV